MLTFMPIAPVAGNKKTRTKENPSRFTTKNIFLK